jgi:hypothetical protein
MTVSAEQDHLVIAYETIAAHTVGNACLSTAVGPDVIVNSGARLRLQAPLHTFFDEFSVSGQLSVYDVCLLSQELETILKKPGGYDLCIPPQDFDIDLSGVTVGTASLCSASLCADGLASGCPLHVTITGASADFDTATIEATIEADDAQLDLLLDFQFGADESCDLDFTEISGAASANLPTVPVCSDQYSEIQGLSAFGLAQNYNLAASGCTFSGILTFLINVLEPYLNDQLRDLTADLLGQELNGVWICLP